MSNTKLDLHYIDLKDLPPVEPAKAGDKRHPFYEIAFSRHWKDANIMLALNEIRKSEPEKDTDEKNRATLGKLKAYIQMMDIEYAVEAVQTKTDVSEEELPEPEAGTYRPEDFLPEGKE